jgi:hypothetical protein
MAGINPDQQKFGTLSGGARMECGEFTNSGDGTIFVPTTFTKLFGGLCCADLTDTCAGRAVSICAGPTIQFAMTDSTGAASVSYIAFGW